MEKHVQRIVMSAESSFCWKAAKRKLMKKAMKRRNAEKSSAISVMINLYSVKIHYQPETLKCERNNEENESHLLQWKLFMRKLWREEMSTADISEESLIFSASSLSLREILFEADLVTHYLENSVWNLIWRRKYLEERRDRGLEGNGENEERKYRRKTK